MNVRKSPIKKKDIPKIIGRISEIYAKMGSKVVYYNIKRDAPAEKELVRLLEGRGGKMRSPVLHTGDKIVAGFVPDAYDMVLGG